MEEIEVRAQISKMAHLELVPDHPQLLHKSSAATKVSSAGAAAYIPYSVTQLSTCVMQQSYCHHIFHALVLLSFNVIFLVRRAYLNHGEMMTVSVCECTLRIVWSHEMARVPHVRLQALTICKELG